MATRVDEGALALSQRTEAFPSTLNGALESKESALPFTLVTEEPFVEVSERPLLAPFHAEVLPLQRIVDLTLATICLLVLWPIMAMAALLVLIGSRGPIFYSQPRIGHNGEIFGCLKFRTMAVDADRLLQDLLDSSPAHREIWARDRKFRDDPRITPGGHFLRRFSIDELPQIFNVLRGEMSMVGPRPLATDEAHFYADAFSTYCSLKPGITGPWQVGGRNKISFQARAQLDCEYARTKSYRQDFALILRTIPVVLRGSGF
jgi:exopolysaccharide production protein ExoY